MKNLFFTICLIIYNSKKLSDLKAFAEKKKGKCLSDTYLGEEEKHKWECEKGHQWDSTPYSIIKMKTWCLLCSKNKRKKK